MMDRGMEVRRVLPEELTEVFLSGFRHRQIIREIWVREGDGYVLSPTDLIREWSDEKRRWIPLWLREQAEAGGAVFAAFSDSLPVGFASLDGCLSEGEIRYANLTMLFVDDRVQRLGIGSRLFRAVCVRASEMGADRLFISAVPSRETVAFYFKMGCRDAQIVPPGFVDTEKDRFMELVLPGFKRER